MSDHGKWVIVPANQTLSGKPERRFQMKSGQYRETEPNSAEWYDAMYGQPARNMVGGLDSMRLGLYDFLAEHDGDPSTNPGDLSPKAPSGLTKEQQKALIEGPDGAAARITRIKAESDALVDAARKDPSHKYHNLFHQSSGQAPAQSIEPIVDRNAARDEVYKQMMQQYGGSTKEEAYANAPRSNEVGYSQRADIQAWMKANAGTKMVEQFMAKQREKGLIDETSTEFGGTRLMQPKGNSLEAIDSRKQGAMVNPATGQTNIQDAQDSLNRVNAQEVADMMRGEAQVEGLEFGNIPGQPRMINQAAMISKGEQAVGQQAKKTEAAIPLWDKSMQPYSAGSDIGIEPSQVWNMANNGELPVFGGGKLLFGRYAGK